MNRLNAKAGATFCADKENDGAGFLLHKCKEGAIQWLYRYTYSWVLYERHREMGLGALRDVF
ncbi:hypothetical protein BHOIPH791_05270 [Bartonella henselae]|nr:hypothetical protein [Bartonella henselae]ETS06119.1 hypothetical protein Q653_01507 [Bartonella henselae JK 42]ETS07448.1 hypothetical protein Q654_01356 [Bartonella henselae JK 50]ETS07766.1 hypothetical protein Q655_01307 [Bartonella henselae JK 51]ETS11133.1 hypothetical protein Q652_01480 [Bartonella henselae JK 41]KEC55914.1 hypothetical protein O97_01449 [Bartonella henselae str. Zeus]KEC58965.1 hypothetical protein O95_01456 [Bartonella henselae JK 53]PNM38914.1 hypothetical prote